MLVMIDNYDSFTYNIVQYFKELNQDITIFRNDKITCKNLFEKKMDALIVSPGPCTPQKAGISCEAIKIASTKNIPVFGICLGFQSIGEVFGAKVVHAPYLMHGKTSKIYHNNTDIFRGLPSPFNATRYHSLAIAPDTVPDSLEVTAKTEDGVIMGIKHKKYPIYGVQFHPESILTEHGHDMLSNFLNI
ncbi:MAG: aminodeoxychorismate/anthranilate synthase component II [bacterium]|nr:aminodeoxychorismate/anthranilate synthase component II [bacterium]